MEDLSLIILLQPALQERLYYQYNFPRQQIRLYQC
nr:MAG TPA: Per os infectivity factor [Bacteriophage sp.]